MSDLDARLLAAHHDDNTSELVSLYTEAADAASGAEQRAFFLTHAYVFALEIGHDDASELRARLVEMGRI